MNGKSTFSAPATGRQQAWALPHLTHTHTKPRDGSIVRERFRLTSPPTLFESVPKYPSPLNKRTKWQEVIRDTAGLKIASVLTDRAVFHDLHIVLLVYTLNSYREDSD